MTTGNERWLDPELVNLRREFIAAWDRAGSLAPEAGADAPELTGQESAAYRAALEEAIAAEERFIQARRRRDER